MAELANDHFSRPAREVHQDRGAYIAASFLTSWKSRHIACRSIRHRSRGRFRLSVQQIIPFNKPFVAGKELYYIAQAVAMGNIAADGYFTKACSKLLEEQFGIPTVLMTPSCTAALEMAAILCDLKPDDEVIVPSFTFVSTVNAFVRLGARPVFVDIRPDTMNIDDTLIERAITPRTKAIIPVHYAGVACRMSQIMAIARREGLFVIEDAAQGVNAFYEDKALGSIGHMGAYSFHETKNYICGEGGGLCINDPRFVERAEIIRDKGTNRKQFFRGLVDKYTWVDIGSSYVPSEILARSCMPNLNCWKKSPPAAGPGTSSIDGRWSRWRWKNSCSCRGSRKSAAAITTCSTFCSAIAARGTGCSRT